jgi:hypothetical protein
VRAIVGEVLAARRDQGPALFAGRADHRHARHVSGDLRHARALFTVHDADAAAMERVRQGLEPRERLLPACDRAGCG